MVRSAPLGQLLVQAGVLSPSALETGLQQQRVSGERLGQVLVSLQLVQSEDVARTLAKQLALPYAAPPLQGASDARALVDGDIARRLKVVPLWTGQRELSVAMEDPLDLEAISALEFHTGRRVRAEVASPTAVAAGLLGSYGGELTRLAEALPNAGPSPARSQQALEREASSAPVVQLVDSILTRAVRARASDVHLEGGDRHLVVRLRVDGLLRRLFEVEEIGRDAVISRLKIMAGMDIAERRRPQDGGFSLDLGTGHPLTVRASSLPVEGGEKIVLRLLDPALAPTDLDSLGLADNDLLRLRRALAANQGLILVAGPTGSGKSTTLQAALGELDRTGRNVVSIEDPIEYRIAGVQHVQVRRAAGLTFPSILRSVLRQDPDVIMVGEVRDGETAEIAISAAVTGHLVLSTVHTVDAAGGLTRLMNMGVAPYLVAAGVTAVVAQRLIRTLCPTCEGRHRGCTGCTDGYHGRTGAFQVLLMDDSLREQVLRSASTVELRRRARRAGTRTLVEDAQRVVAEGRTSPHEVARVLQSDPGGALPCTRCGGTLPDEARCCPHCGIVTEPRCACDTPLRSGWAYCPHCARRLQR